MISRGLLGTEGREKKEERRREGVMVERDITVRSVNIVKSVNLLPTGGEGV